MCLCVHVYVVAAGTDTSSIYNGGQLFLGVFVSGAFCFGGIFVWGAFCFGGFCPRWRFDWGAYCPVAFVQGFFLPGVFDLAQPSFLTPHPTLQLFHVPPPLRKMLGYAHISDFKCSNFNGHNHSEKIRIRVST